MKTSLAEIVQQKQETKKQLSNLKNRYLAIIYGGLSKQQDVKQIHKRLFDETINQKKLGKATSAKMLNVAFSSVNVLSKKVGNIASIKKQVKAKYGVDDNVADLPIILGLFVFDLLKKKNVEKSISSVIVKEADKNEGETKDKVIADTLRQNLDKSRQEVLKSTETSEIETDKIMIFYLASAHKDSASDHAPYQGKMYVDENWETIPMPWALHNAIAYYIKTHYVKSMQWVVGKPVWFITRPNCRHYFKELSVKEVLATARTKLIKKYDMKTAIGDRQYLQTMKHSTSKDWYDDVRNAQLLLNSYKERLSMHELMYKENPCSTIKNAIAKDKFLIQKWEKYIDEKETK